MSSQPRSNGRGAIFRASGLLISFVVLLISIKVADMIVERATNTTTELAAEWSREPRHIILRELPPNLSTRVRPLPGDIAESDGLNPTREYALRTDKDGFILGGESSEGHPDIVFVGGSTTECKYVDERTRFPALVATLLRRSDGSNVATKNAGLSGNHTIHSMLNIIAKVIPFRPRHVVLMEDINDLALLMHTGSYWIAPGGKAIVQTTEKEQDNRSIAARAKDALLPNIWRRYIRHLVPGKALEPPGDEFTGFRALDTSRDHINDDFRSSLVSLVDVLRAWRIEPVLMTQFNRIVVSDAFLKSLFERQAEPWTWAEFVNHYQEFNAITRSVAAETHTALIDLDAMVPHSRDYMFDAVHVNDEGSKLVAEVISKELAGRFREYKLASAQ